MNIVDQIKYDSIKGDYRQLARALTIVENELEGSAELLRALPTTDIPVIGVTGPPGAGKSTLVNGLVDRFSLQGKRIGVLAIDPTSPFNQGSLLGDRIRMSGHFNRPNVFIRSIATRGSLGGLSSKTIEISDLIKAAGFDLVIIETVGVGQSEVEIAALADVTVVILVPESGDEIQNIKSGLMEIADIYAVNKADREGASEFANNLRNMISQRSLNVPVITTIAHKGEGIDHLALAIMNCKSVSGDKKLQLLTEKAWHLIRDQRMRSVERSRLMEDLKTFSSSPGFNLYRYVEEHY